MRGLLVRFVPARVGHEQPQGAAADLLDAPASLGRGGGCGDEFAVTHSLAAVAGPVFRGRGLSGPVLVTVDGQGQQRHRGGPMKTVMKTMTSMVNPSTELLSQRVMKHPKMPRPRALKRDRRRMLVCEAMSQ